MPIEAPKHHNRADDGQWKDNSPLQAPRLKKFYDLFETTGFKKEHEISAADVVLPELSQVSSLEPFDSNLLKVEYLITRSCNLVCGGCSMPTPAPYRLELGAEQKKLIAHSMRILKIPFTAIYGSEPTMLSVEELGSTIKAIEDCGTFATIITNGMNLTEEYMDRLHGEYGLRSLTMSCDDLDPKQIKDPSTAAKSNRTFKMLPLWQKKYVEKGLARDAQLTITVHSRNVKILPEFVKFWTDKGIYVSLDLIHYNNRHDLPAAEGTKVTSKESSEPVIFKTDEDFLNLSNSMEQLIRMKQEGALVWNSIDSLYHMSQLTARSIYRWRCKPTDFLTVDSSGEVFFCILDVEDNIVCGPGKIYYKPDDVKIGDMLFAYNEESKTWTETQVLNKRSRIVSEYYRVEAESHHENLKENTPRTNLFMTGEHPVMTDSGWVETRDLKPGMRLLAYPEPELKKAIETGIHSENSKTIYRVVTEVEKIVSPGKVVNFTCEKPLNNFIVNGVLTHNCDDFQPRSYGDRLFIWDLLTPEKLENMLQRNRDWMDLSKHPDACKGCEWQTHQEAARVIKSGKVALSHYVHGK